MSSGNDLPCQEVIERIDDYLEETMENVPQFEAHYAACRSCHAYLVTYARTIGMLQAMPTIEPAAERLEIIRRSKG